MFLPYSKFPRSNISYFVTLMEMYKPCIARLLGQGQFGDAKVTALGKISGIHTISNVNGIDK